MRRQDVFEAFVIVAVLVFQAFFYHAKLYGSGASDIERLRRTDVLDLALFPPLGEQPNLFADALDRLARTEHLPQRVPLFSTALAIVIAAVLAGDALRHVMLPRRDVGRFERLLLAYGLGMAALSLGTQGLGLAGSLSRETVIGATVAIAIAWLMVVTLRRRGSKPDPVGAESPPTEREPSKSLRIALTMGIAPFLLLSLLASALPTTDYDALGYHLLGPKEYFLAGRISFLPHNVYTTFPFLTEMFHLLAMTILDDSQSGALAGQMTLWTFGLAGGGAVGLLASRLFGPTAGWLGAFVYLTTPWIYRLSHIPYVEGALLFYAALALHCALRSRVGDLRWKLVAGSLAGTAIACKYTGLVMVAVPVAIVSLVARRHECPNGNPESRLLPGLAAFALGCALFAGPWLLRNWYWTGNPVYPLAYSIFDGTNWTKAKADAFGRAHRASDFGIATIWRYVAEIAAHSDWQTALAFTFAPVALLGVTRSRALGLWMFVAYTCVAFWALTHRLDRFWLSLEPFVAALAGAGMVWSRSRPWIATVFLSATVAAVYNLAYCTTALCGLNAYTADLNVQRQDNVRAQSAALATVNEARILPEDATVLFVGLAAVHYSERRSLYNTVFDDHRFVTLARREGPGNESKPPEEIRRALLEQGIDFIAVDWNEIARYRQPGGYGYPAFVRPEVFVDLVRAGVLQRLPTYAPDRAWLFRVLEETEEAP